MATSELKATKDTMLGRLVAHRHGEIWDVLDPMIHDKGTYPDEAALVAAWPVAEAGDYAAVLSTDTKWIWDTVTAAWIDTGIPITTVAASQVSNDSTVAGDTVKDALETLSLIPNSVIYVDPSYTGTDGDGTINRPFILIEDAMVALGAGTILLAPGTYDEDVAFSSQVQLVGMSPDASAVTLQGDISGLDMFLKNLTVDGGDTVEADGDVVIDNCVVKLPVTASGTVKFINSEFTDALDFAGDTLIENCLVEVDSDVIAISQAGGVLRIINSVVIGQISGADDYLVVSDTGVIIVDNSKIMNEDTDGKALSCDNDGLEPDVNKLLNSTFKGDVDAGAADTNVSNILLYSVITGTSLIYQTIPAANVLFVGGETLNPDTLPIVTDTDPGAVPAMGVAAGNFLRDDGTWAALPVGVTTFLGLTDTPSTYHDMAGKTVAVNGAENALEFVDNVATDEKVKVSVLDPSAGYLNGKLVAGDGLGGTEAVDHTTFTLANTDKGSSAVAAHNLAYNHALFATDSLVVHLAGAENITGTKTFTPDAGVNSAAVSGSGMTVIDTFNKRSADYQARRILLKVLVGEPGEKTTFGVDESGYMTLNGTTLVDGIINDNTLATGNAHNLATTSCLKSYIDGIIAAANALVYKGVIDCSLNPNYPAADCGYLYIVSVAGKIGGALGDDVLIGDMLLCNTDSTPAGTKAEVGARWNIVPKSYAGVVFGPASATDTAIALFDGATGKAVKNSLVTIDAAGSVNIPAGQAYKKNNVALAYSDVGAAAAAHYHSGADITSGNLDIARMPLGGNWALTSTLVLNCYSANAGFTVRARRPVQPGAAWTRAAAVITFDGGIVPHNLLAGDTITVSVSSSPAALPIQDYAVTVSNAFIFTVGGVDAGAPSGTATWQRVLSYDNAWDYDAAAGEHTFNGAVNINAGFDNVDFTINKNSIAPGPAYWYDATADLHTFYSDVVINTLTVGLGKNGLSGCTALGVDALATNNTGDSLVAIGDHALYLQYDGQSNVAVGASALYNNTDGSYNVAVGTTALNTNVTGLGNTALGHQALQYCTADYNIGIGYNAALNIDGGTNNIGIGYAVMGGCSSGIGNISIGSSAGDNITTGSNNICIGNSTAVLDITGVNQIVIGHGAAGMGQNTAVLGVWNTTVGTYLYGTTYLADDVVAEGGAIFNNSAKDNDFTIKARKPTQVGAAWTRAVAVITFDGGTVAHGLLAGDTISVLSSSSEDALAIMDYLVTVVDDYIFSVVGSNGGDSDGTASWTRSLAYSNAYVYDAGTGIHTFTTFPVGPSAAPTTDYQFANKKYVDDAIAGENLWDRASTTLSPHTAGDGISIGAFTGAGVTVFNNTAIDVDFTIKKLTSGTAYLYDAGLDSHTFGSGLSVSGNVSVSTGSKYQINSVNMLHLGNGSLTDNLIVGNGGASLTHVAGSTGYYNTAVGLGAGAALTEAYQCVAIGSQAMNSNTAGYDNIAIGFRALRYTVGSATVGNQNIAIGSLALQANVSSNMNVVVGHSAGLTATGQGNTLIGHQAGTSIVAGSGTMVGWRVGFSNISGTNNAFFGASAGYSSLGSYNTYIGQSAAYYQARVADANAYNTAVGYRALYGTNGLSTCQYCTAIGSTALYVNTTGNSNTAVGCSALEANTEGGQNVAIGNNSLISNTTGYQNIAIGYRAARYCVDGHQNVAIGDNAHAANITGDENVIIGISAGFSSLSNSNVMIGMGAGYSSTTGIGSVYVGHQAGYRQNRVADTNAYNTAVGQQALSGQLGLSTGQYCVAIGASALYSNTTGSRNHAAGFAASYSNTVADDNMSIGYKAGYTYGTDATNTKNVAIGNQAQERMLGGVTFSHDNIAVGYNAMRGSATASDNTAYNNVGIGTQALEAITTAYGAVMIGYRCGYKITSGSANLGIGHQCLSQVTTQANNVAIGFDTLLNTTGGNNIAVGSGAMYMNIGGGNNTLMGYTAMRNSSTGSCNVAVGADAGRGGVGTSAVTGIANNTYIGYQAGYNSSATVSIANSICLGYMAGKYETASYKLFIDAIDRTDEATARTSSLMYGVMHATVSSQTLRINAALTVGGSLTVTPVALTGTPSSGITLNAAAHTALTASTEFNAVLVNGAVTQQFATGALTTQRFMRIDAPTYSAVGASTITTAATFAINNAPTAGANATITNAYALWIQAGIAQFNGAVQAASSLSVYRSAAYQAVASIRADAAPAYNADGVKGERCYTGGYVYECIVTGTGGSGRWVRYVVETSY